jgi:hypothetical protein
MRLQTFRLSPKQHEAMISGALALLRTAYPTQARSFSSQERQATTALWQDMFRGVAPQTMTEAVTRFIASDRKAFFPAPGQIMGCIEQIIAEQQAEADRIAGEAQLAKIYETARLIESGEHCGTCIFGRCETGKLFCENPQSPKWWDKPEWCETEKTVRCDLFQGGGVVA